MFEWLTDSELPKQLFLFMKSNCYCYNVKFAKIRLKADFQVFFISFKSQIKLKKQYSLSSLSRTRVSRTMTEEKKSKIEKKMFGLKCLKSAVFFDADLSGRFLRQRYFAFYSLVCLFFNVWYGT